MLPSSLVSVPGSDSDSSSFCDKMLEQSFRRALPDGQPPSSARTGKKKSSAPRQSAPRDSAPRDAAPRESAPRGSAPRETAPRETAPRVSTPRVEDLPRVDVSPFAETDVDVAERTAS